jgi:uncharacterized protein
MDDDEYRRDLDTERTMRDRFMAHHAESPFVSSRLHDFSGLAYFPFDRRYRVSARLERRPAPEEAYLRTNRGGQAVMRYLGDLVFALDGETLRLRVYHAGEGVGTSVFVPFRDRTCGRESYASGRYLTFEMTEDDVYELDFNRAFNPYCAYTEAYECPFPPVENDLPVRIAAGEQAWKRAPELAAAPGAPGARRSRSGPRPGRGPRAPRSRSRTSPARRPVRSRGTRPRSRTE